MNILNDDGTFFSFNPNMFIIFTWLLLLLIILTGIGGYKTNKTSLVLLKNIHYGPSNIDV